MADSILVTSVEGNSQRLDGGAMFGNVPRALWSRWMIPDEQGRVLLHCRCLLVKVAGQLILLETGIGSYMDEKMAQRFGVEEREHCLLENLKKMNIDPSDIDVVILSHLHFDHAGGLLKAFDDTHAETDQKELVFSKAQFVVGREAFERSENPHPRDRASYIVGLADALKNSGRLTLVERGQSGKDVGLPDCFHFHYSDGHTPGQMHCLIQGDKQSLFFAGDLIPGLAWVHLPITMGYDRYPEKLIDEKADLYKQAHKDEWLIFYTHDPAAAASFLEFDEIKSKYSGGSPVIRLENYELS